MMNKWWTPNDLIFMATMLPESHMDEASQIALGCRHKYELARLLTYTYEIQTRTEEKTPITISLLCIYKCTHCNGATSSNNVVTLVGVHLVAK